MSWRDELPVVAFLSGLTFGVVVLARLLLPAVASVGGWMAPGWTGPVAGIAVEVVPAIAAVPVGVLAAAVVYDVTHRTLTAERLSRRALVGIVSVTLAVVVCLCLATVIAFGRHPFRYVVVPTAALIGLDRGIHAARRDAASVFPGPSGTTLLLTGVLVVGIIVGGPASYAFDGRFVDTGREVPPHAEFETDYRSTDGSPAIVTISHAGGDPIAADELQVDIHEARATDGTMQNESGQWAGEATGGPAKGPSSRATG